MNPNWEKRECGGFKTNIENVESKTQRETDKKAHFFHCQCLYVTNDWSFLREKRNTPKPKKNKIGTTEYNIKWKEPYDGDAKNNGSEENGEKGTLYYGRKRKLGIVVTGEWMLLLMTKCENKKRFYFFILWCVFYFFLFFLLQRDQVFTWHEQESLLFACCCVLRQKIQWDTVHMYYTRKYHSINSLVFPSRVYLYLLLLFFFYFLFVLLYRV